MSNKNPAIIDSDGQWVCHQGAFPLPHPSGVVMQPGKHIKINLDSFLIGQPTISIVSGEYAEDLTEDQQEALNRANEDLLKARHELNVVSVQKAQEQNFLESMSVERLAEALKERTKSDEAKPKAKSGTRATKSHQGLAAPYAGEATPAAEASEASEAADTAGEATSDVATADVTSEESK